MYMSRTDHRQEKEPASVESALGTPHARDTREEITAEITAQPRNPSGARRLRPPLVMMLVRSEQDKLKPRQTPTPPSPLRPCTSSERSCFSASIGSGVRLVVALDPNPTLLQLSADSEDDFERLLEFIYIYIILERIFTEKGESSHSPFLFTF